MPDLRQRAIRFVPRESKYKMKSSTVTSTLMFSLRGEKKKKVKPTCNTPYRAIVCAYCLVYRHRDACLHVSCSGGEKPRLVGFNMYVLPAGQVFSCHAACVIASHDVCVGCFTSGMISSARILVCLKLRVHAVQLIGSQVQTRLQTPPAE